jgi:hypothetical protein
MVPLTFKQILFRREIVYGLKPLFVQYVNHRELAIRFETYNILFKFLVNYEGRSQQPTSIVLSASQLLLLPSVYLFPFALKFLLSPSTSHHCSF